MPKHLNSRCKELVASLISYFESERDNNGPFLPLTAVRERVAAALKLNISTVSAISSTVKQNEVLKSPKKKRHYAKRVTNVEKLDTGAIREAIYQMYEAKQHVTLATLRAKLRDRELFDGSQTSLRRLLKELGFRWKKDDPRRGLMELADVAFKRIVFLKAYMREKEESLYQFVFLDETWIFQNGTIGRSWQNDNKRSVKFTKVDGKRFIILHAGNEHGFIKGAEAIFSSKTKLSDYHGEMNQENFLQWFENQLLKNLTNSSVIVIDNAPYHSMLLVKTPNSSWNKVSIQEWLTNNGIDFNPTLFKPELLNIVARHKPPKKYIVDDMAERYGHKVLRLPPYHCMFNPIEHIWGIAKTYYNRHIGRDGNSEINCLEMWKEALATVTPEMWSNSVRHTEGEVTKWFEREHAMDRLNIEPIVIHVDQNSDENSDSSFDDYSDSDV